MQYCLHRPCCSESINAHKRNRNKLVPPLFATVQPATDLSLTAPAPSVLSLGGENTSPSCWCREASYFFLFQSNLSRRLHICFCLHLGLFNRARPSSWARRRKDGTLAVAPQTCERPPLFTAFPYPPVCSFAATFAFDFVPWQEKRSGDRNIDT